MSDGRVPSVPGVVADELLSEVYAQCAHELRGALGLLVAAVDELEDEGGAPPGATTYLERGIARLEGLASRYARVAEALDGGIGHEARPFRLGDAVAQACERVARTTGSVDVVAEGDAGHLGLGDEATVAEALCELVLAASRLSESGRVHVRAEAAGDAAALVVWPDAPLSAWPALPRPPRTDGLSSRPGLWLAVALVQVQGGQVTQEAGALRLQLPAAG